MMRFLRPLDLVDGFAFIVGDNAALVDVGTETIVVGGDDAAVLDGKSISMAPLLVSTVD